MGTSTNANICFGVAFDEGHEFPWDGEFEGDLQQWWVFGVHEFKRSFELFDAGGNFLSHVDQNDKELLSRYFDEDRQFLKANPVPIEMVNCCSGDYPIYILATPSSIRVAARGDPLEFNPIDLLASEAEAKAMIEFFANHGIEPGREPGWILSSYWG